MRWADCCGVIEITDLYNALPGRGDGGGSSVHYLQTMFVLRLPGRRADTRAVNEPEIYYGS